LFPVGALQSVSIEWSIEVEERVDHLAHGLFMDIVGEEIDDYVSEES
jgi:predicted transcriptional regulator